MVVNHAWTVRTDERRQISTEMQLMKCTGGYIFSDCGRNKEVMIEIHISQLTEFIE
jgi:hypothetical protein